MVFANGNLANYPGLVSSCSLEEKPLPQFCYTTVICNCLLKPTLIAIDRGVALTPHQKEIIIKKTTMAHNAEINGSLEGQLQSITQFLYLRLRKH